MLIKITGSGIFNSEGREIAVGSELTVKNEPTGWAGRYEIISGGGAGKTGVTNPAGENDENAEFVAPVGPFTAKDAGSGWWAIFDGKDQQVGKKARKGDLDGFDTLSDEDKLEFATQHAKTAFDADQKKA